MKSVKITPPKGYEVDKENSTFEEIKFKPIEYLTLSIIVDKVINTNRDSIKILAFERFVQIARYYNGNWYPNWLDFNEQKYFIYLCEDKYFITCRTTSPENFCCFKSREDAQKVIDNPNFRGILDTLYK